MKRILTVLFCLLLSVSAYSGDKLSFLKKKYTTNTGYELNYRILYPANYKPEKKYPLILFLHGAGERGNDNEAQLVHGGNLLASYENRTNYPAIIIAPQCPAETYWVDYKRPSAEGEKRYFYPSNTITKPLAAVKELVDSYISKGLIDKNNMHIAGLSMGGIGTFDLVFRYPDMFVTATPICGGVNTQRAEKFRGKTIFRIFHGADDSVVDVKFSRDAYAALQKAGAKVSYKEYPGVNHNSWDNAFAEPDFVSWMF